MAQDAADQIETLRESLEEGDRSLQFEADRDHLLQMSNNIQLVPSKIGDHRHLQILRHSTRMAEHAHLPTAEEFQANDETPDGSVQDLLVDEGLLGACLEYRAPAEAIVRWIHDEYSNEHTNQDYRSALRNFGTYRLKRDEPPESLEWIPTGTSNDFDPVPSERDILDYQRDVQPMVEAAENPRDEAIIMVQFEAGLRAGELYDLRVGDVFDSDHSTGLHVDGKLGERTVHLIMSVPYLQAWLNDSRCPSDADAFFVNKLSGEGRPSYQGFLKCFRGPAERAGVSKEVTPTAFRKANTRWLVNQGFSQARIEDRQGRARGSEHTARYMARFGEDSNELAYAKLHGKDVDGDEPDEVGPVECHRCHRETPREKDFCMWCHAALSFEATEQVDDLDDATAESIAESADPDLEDIDPEDVLELREEVQESPALQKLLASLM